MNVYDFDGPIYRGESAFDFYLFTIRKNPKAMKFLFVVVKSLVLYKLCRISEETFRQLVSTYAKEYISMFSNPRAVVEEFWDGHLNKIKPWYFDRQKDDDLILSATPKFLLEECFRRIGIQKMLTSVIDPKTGEIERLCFRKEKAVHFKALYPGKTIKNFYTDSKNDEAMFSLSENVYLVKGNRIIKWK